jgi:RNA polymerase sigma-70 factor (ECF subfamily)
MILFFALPDTPVEDELLVKARNGNQKAIAQIYEIYFDPVYQFIRWRVDDLALAEDLTSEVFIKLLGALQGRNAPQQSLRGWLFRVARNVLHDHYQRTVKTDDLGDDLPAEADFEMQMIQEMDIERVRRAITMLAEDQQEVLILRFGQMLNLNDTAESMGKSISAVKSLQFRAVNTLRDLLNTPALEVDFGSY